MQIFLSYSSRDEETANRLFEYFSYTFTLSREDIFLSCVSVGVRHAEDAIVRAVKDADFLVFLISEHFLRSSYCMCELGAAWILKKEFFILLDGITRDDERVVSLPPYIRDMNNVEIHSGEEGIIVNYFEAMLRKMSKLRNPSPTSSANIVELARDISRVPEEDILIDLRQAAAFHNPETARKTLKIDARSRESFSAIVDYMSIKPNYAGIAINLTNQSWYEACGSDKSLCFEICASEILSLTMEIKRYENGQRVTIATEDIDIGTKTQWKKRLIDLASAEKYEDLAEIVFLVEPSSFSGFSKYEISNLKIM